MSSKHERSSKPSDRVAPWDEPRAQAQPARSAPTPAADLTARLGSTPIVLKRVEVRCGGTGADPNHNDPFMFLAAIERNCGPLFRFEIHRESTAPTVEAFVGRTEATLPTELLRNFVRPPQEGPAE